MNIYKHKFLSRIGMMHMIAVNLCVWLNVLILETSHEIVGHTHEGDRQGQQHQNTPAYHNDDYGSLMNMTNGLKNKDTFYNSFHLKSLK